RSRTNQPDPYCLTWRAADDLGWRYACAAHRTDPRPEWACRSQWNASGIYAVVRDRGRAATAGYDHEGWHSADEFHAVPLRTGSDHGIESGRGNVGHVQDYRGGKCAGGYAANY